MKKEDIKTVAEIVGRLRELGVPEILCDNIDFWNKKEEEIANAVRVVIPEC